MERGGDGVARGGADEGRRTETAGARRRGGSAGGDVFVATFSETGASFVGVGCLFGTVRVDARGGPAAAENAEGAEGAAEAVACVAPATRPNANLRLAVGSRFAETRAGSIDVFLSADSRSGSWGPFSAAGSAVGPLALVAGREGGDALAFAAGPRGFGGVALACVGRTAAGAPMAPALGTTDGGSGGLLEGGLGLVFARSTEGALLRCAAPAYPAGAGGFRAVSVVSSVFSGDAAGGLHAHALTRARRVDGFVTVAVRAAPSVRDASPPAVAVADGFANPPTRVSGADFFPSDETSPFFCVSFGTRSPARVVSSALAICPGVESHAARRFVEATGAGVSRLDVGWALDRLGGRTIPGSAPGRVDPPSRSTPTTRARRGTPPSRTREAPEGLLAGVGLSRAPVVVALPSRGGAEVRVRLGSVDPRRRSRGAGARSTASAPSPRASSPRPSGDALDLGAAFLACVSPAMAPSRATGSLPRLTLTRLRARATHEGLDLAARGPEAPVVVVVASGGSDEETFLETRETSRSNRPAVVALARFSPEALDAGGGTVATATASPESPGFFAFGGSFGARCVFALGGSFPGAARITAVTDARVVSAAVATCEAPGVRSAAGGYSYAFGGSFVSGAASVATSRSRDDDAFFEEEGVVSAPPSSFSSALFWRRAPTVRSVTPSRGPAAGGTAATVRGRGFADGRGSPSAWVGAPGPVAGRAARLDDGAEAAEFVTPAAAPAVRPVAVSATSATRPTSHPTRRSNTRRRTETIMIAACLVLSRGFTRVHSTRRCILSGDRREAARRLNDVGAGPTTKRASPDVSPAAAGASRGSRARTSTRRRWRASGASSRATRERRRSSSPPPWSRASSPRYQRGLPEWGSRRRREKGPSSGTPGGFPSRRVRRRDFCRLRPPLVRRGVRRVGGDGDARGFALRRDPVDRLLVRRRRPDGGARRRRGGPKPARRTVRSALRLPRARGIERVGPRRRENPVARERLGKRRPEW